MLNHRQTSWLKYIFTYHRPEWDKNLNREVCSTRLDITWKAFSWRNRYWLPEMEHNRAKCQQILEPQTTFS